MWLVLYVATLASLSALTLLQDLAPIALENNQPPHGDM
jgi:hypothetical protein